MSKELQDIEALMKEFRDATHDYELAHERAQAASSTETSALHRLSEAQKAIDAWHEAVKKSAPWNSEWHQQPKRKHRAAEAA